MLSDASPDHIASPAELDLSYLSMLMHTQPWTPVVDSRLARRRRRCGHWLARGQCNICHPSLTANVWRGKLMECSGVFYHLTLWLLRGTDLSYAAFHLYGQGVADCR